MALHGENDQNVPVIGGPGAQGVSRTHFGSQAATAKVWQNSGASYDLQIIKGAGHSVDTLSTQLTQLESQTLAQKIARFLGLL
jgi:hypothetical protein